MPRFREEVLNVALARGLTARGLDANAETIFPSALPDVLIELDGLKLVIEGRNARQKASLLRDSRERVESGLADVSVAVLYPVGLNDAPSQEELSRRVDAGLYDGAVFYLSRTGIRSDDFARASLDQIAELVRSANRIRIQNDIVQAQVQAVEAAIEHVVQEASNTNLFFASEALVTRLRSALGLPPAPIPAIREKANSEKDLFRIASFILFDALVFHDVLAAGNAAFRPLGGATVPMQAFLEGEWKKILGVDYGPIFLIASEVLSSFPSSPTSEEVLTRLVTAARSVATSGVLTRHDFMGRVYHKLLLRTTGKFYATYYTSIQAAALLANLEFRTPGDSWDTGSVDAISRFRLIDPACGSGTLLSAAYVVLKDRYIVSRPIPLQLAEFHRTMVEDVVYGWDVLDYAAHLTLTTLALHANNASVDGSHVYTLAAGVSATGTPQLGSLDYLKPQTTFRGHGFTDPTQQQSIGGARQLEEILVPEFDAVIMNPPFSRSSKPKVKFGYATPLGQKALSKDLSTLARDIGAPGLSVAGLGAFFMRLALRLTKPGSRIGVVIPRSMLSGVSWRNVREHYLSECAVEYIVSNFDPDDLPGPAPWSWSENTNLGEVLIVARRVEPVQPSVDDRESIATQAPPSPAKTTFINVWRRPRNEVESLLLAHQAIAARSDGFDLMSGSWTALGNGKDPVAAVYDVPQSFLTRNWLSPCVLSHPELNLFGLRLHASEWPSIRLGDAAELGPDIRQIKSSFSETTARTAHRVLWGQQAARNALRLPDNEVGYGVSAVKSATQLHAAKAATLLLADRPHLTTEAILATSVYTPVLATAFWEVQLKPGQCDACFLLWFNSTYGFFEYLGEVTSSRGDIFKGKKNQVQNLRLPQLDRHDECQALLSAVGSSSLLPFGQEFALAAGGGGVRKRLDAFWSHTLSLPEVSGPYYELLAADPVIAKGTPTSSADDDDEEDASDEDSPATSGNAGPESQRAGPGIPRSTPPGSRVSGAPVLTSMEFKVEGESQPLLRAMFEVSDVRAGAVRGLPGDLQITVLDRVDAPKGLFDATEEGAGLVVLSLQILSPGGPDPVAQSLQAVRALFRWMSGMSVRPAEPLYLVLGAKRLKIGDVTELDDSTLVSILRPITTW